MKRTTTTAITGMPLTLADLRELVEDLAYWPNEAIVDIFKGGAGNADNPIERAPDTVSVTKEETT